MDASIASLSYPVPEAPAPGTITQIAPGVRWLRLALPFALDHVNIYLIADGDGEAVLDTGIADEPTRAVWETLLAGGLRPTRLILTHFHPDHIGLANWLVGKCGAPVSMPLTEYLFAQNLRHNREALGSATHHDFYTENGLPDAEAELLMGRGHHYLRMTTGLPPVFHRLRAGDTLRLAERSLEIFTGGGHAPEQAMLWDRAGKVFFAADQVLAKISPNISVWPQEPEANPLGIYLESLAALRASVPADVLALPAHNLPFRGLHERLGQLADHHQARCEAVAQVCAQGPRTVYEIIPFMFHRKLDAHQTGFAFGEAMAHVNYMVARGDLAVVPGKVRRFRGA
jgi:glyoxylase-like metal-dependent hydrolase (beta-lactamase superfamily II)